MNKRLLLLSVLAVAILAVPTTASACMEDCDNRPGGTYQCFFNEIVLTVCIQEPGYCWLHWGSCRTGPAEKGEAATESLGAQWQIASVDIEQPLFRDANEEPVRIASVTPSPTR